MSPKTLIIVRQRSKNQSTVSSKAMYSVGSFTAVKTSVIVTSPASGIPAAPTDAMTEVTTIIACSAIERWTPSS